MTRTRLLETTFRGIGAGAAGGLAEVAWVTLYAALTGGNPATIARGVTTAAGVNALFPSSPVALGLAVHLALAVTLGLALAYAWETLRSYRPDLANPYPFMLTALAGIWAINFLIVLPLISPAFVNMVPFAVSLTSKLLFGVAAASTLRQRTFRQLVRQSHRRG